MRTKKKSHNLEMKGSGGTGSLRSKVVKRLPLLFLFFYSLCIDACNFLESSPCQLDIGTIYPVGKGGTTSEGIFYQVDADSSGFAQFRVRFLILFV